MATATRRTTTAKTQVRYLNLKTGRIQSSRGSSRHIHECAAHFQTAAELISEVGLSKTELEALMKGMHGAGDPSETVEVERLARTVLRNLREAGAHEALGDANSDDIEEALRANLARSRGGVGSFQRGMPVTLHAWTEAGGTAVLSDHSGPRPLAVLTANTKSCEERMIVWYIEVATAAIFAIFTVLGLKMKGGKNTQKAAKNVIRNNRTRRALMKLIKKCDGKTLLNLLSEMWDAGLLGKTIKELADFGILGAGLFLIGLAADFIPGAGEAKLLIQCGLATGGIVIAIAHKPDC